MVPISDLWTTSGQPTAAALAGLAARGFQSVIYLAPPTVDSAVKEEPAILAKQGVDYHNIPIPFGAPAEKHFDDFVAAMRLYGKQKLLVHCEVNMRASCMMFLYRTIIRKVPVETAYESVTKVWTPRFAWKPYVESTLARHGIKFEVY
ncbi:MAG: protein tyrosine phosphatase family protein [Betaproteobacteria bacterium]|nr:protein tyrosine phosphatase family protein [Betaproteobacteria bacterium]